jgi:alanine-glyoxylate transaminase/serine-glyoxylate transaminase/serine-pyruvate transaminase
LTAQRYRLMIPGPVDAEDDVLEAMAQQISPHYGPAWLKIYHEALQSLGQLFGTQNDIILLAGPGSAALDATLGSLMRTGEKVLVPSNGFFGQRMATIAQGYGLDARLVQASMGQPVDPGAVRECLAAERDVQAIGVVHLETSTGVLNPSSLGGVPLPVDEWGIDVCVSVTNKCLACPPGIAPLSISQRAWDQIDRKGGRAHGWYLNLRVWKDYSINWGDWHPTPTTMPTNTVMAMMVSLRRILDMGLEANYDRYVQAARTVRGRLEQLGFKMLTKEACTSPLITAMYGLPDMDIADFRRYLREERGIMISGGLDELRGKIFRIGHIGKAASAEYSELLLDGVEAYLRLKGYAVPPREAGD